jgi:hypothetical protein
MTVTKRIVCLANSRKQGGSCVAGKELVDGKPAGWIRPVSSLGPPELMDWEMSFADGGGADILDVIEVPLTKAQPSGFQVENWAIEKNEAWRRAGRVTWTKLAQLVDPVGPLWVNGYQTKSGQNDRIPTGVAEQLKSSLRLIHVRSVELTVEQPGIDFGNHKKRLEASFSHAGADYCIRVTDPKYEAVYLGLEVGAYHVGESYLTVSVGEPYKDGYCYKLVAAIIEQEGRE